MTDPIADMLTRIRNAHAVKKAEVVLPSSKIKLAIAEILKRHGYIKEVKMVADAGKSGKQEDIVITLKYAGKEPAISSLKRLSKPGRRVYASKEELPVVLNNLGIAIISTSRGLMTNKEAKKKNLGGELICEIY